MKTHNIKITLDDGRSWIETVPAETTQQAIQKLFEIKNQDWVRFDSEVTRIDFLKEEELIAHRNELRKKVLLYFYEYNNKYGDSEKRTSSKICEDAEENAAHLFLIDKGLLLAKELSGGYKAIKISTKGINFIKNHSEF